MKNILIKLRKIFTPKRLIIFILVIFFLSVIFLLSYIYELNYEKGTFQEKTDHLFDALMLYQSSFSPRTWKTYLDPDYDFFFSYPPDFSYDLIKENVSVEIKEIRGHNNKNLLDEFWTPECIKKLNNQRKKILLCKNDFNVGKEEIYFICGENLIKVTIEQFPLSEAEFTALVNSFDIY